MLGSPQHWKDSRATSIGGMDANKAPHLLDGFVTYGRPLSALLALAAKDALSLCHSGCITCTINTNRIIFGIFVTRIPGILQ
jgi:hypothetical protein